MINVLFIVLFLDVFISSSESWVYPLTDSSYDSLENELDNSSGGSPGISARRLLHPKPLQGSLDSILTFSDYDQDTDPDVHDKQTRGLKLRPLGRRDAPVVDTSSTLESLSLEGQHTQQRRRSEPAIAYVNSFRPCTSGSTDGLTGDDEDGEDGLSKNYCRRTHIESHSRGQIRRGGGESAAASAVLKNSSSSLSSTPVSPAHTRSSHDSLDSVGGGDQTTRLHPTKTHLTSTSVSPAQYTISSALSSAEHPDSPPKEPVNRGAYKAHRGLHPNSWLKKDRRLSLTQQETLETAEGVKTEVSWPTFTDMTTVSTQVRNIHIT